MHKAFISKKNSFDEDPSQGERFSFTYLFPKYWLVWIFIFLTLLIAYLPTKIRSYLGTALGKLLFKFSKSKKEIAKINLSMTFRDLDHSGIQNHLRRFFK